MYALRLTNASTAAACSSSSWERSAGGGEGGLEPSGTSAHLAWWWVGSGVGWRVEGSPPVQPSIAPRSHPRGAHMNTCTYDMHAHTYMCAHAQVQPPVMHRAGRRSAGRAHAPLPRPAAAARPCSHRRACRALLIRRARHAWRYGRAPPAFTPLSRAARRCRRAGGDGRRDPRSGAGGEGGLRRGGGVGLPAARPDSPLARRGGGGGRVAGGGGRGRGRGRGGCVVADGVGPPLSRHRWEYRGELSQAGV